MDKFATGFCMRSVIYFTLSFLSERAILNP